MRILKDVSKSKVKMVRPHEFWNFFGVIITADGFRDGGDSR